MVRAREEVADTSPPRPCASHPLLLTQFMAAQEIGCGRDFVRGLIDRGEVGTVEVEGRERVPFAEPEPWVRADTRFRKPL